MSVYRFMVLEKAHFPVTFMCRVLEVSRSAFYAWLNREPSKRDREDRDLTEKIKVIHTQSQGTYGSPRIYDALQEQGVAVSRKRVARLMAEAGITGEPLKPFKKTTDSDHDEPIAPNLLNRQIG